MTQSSQSTMLGAMLACVAITAATPIDHYAITPWFSKTPNDQPRYVVVDEVKKSAVNARQRRKKRNQAKKSRKKNAQHRRGKS